MSESFRGACLCGAVHFEVSDVFDAGLCHCTICRRLSGSPVLFWANAPSGSFRLTRGQTGAYRSSERFERHFCATCGSPVFGRNPQPSDGEADLLCFNPTLLEDPEAIRPTAHIWWSSRLPWFEPGDDLPRSSDGELSHPDQRPPWRAR